MLLNLLMMFQAAAEVCPDAALAIISNPVNSTVPIASEMFKKAGKYVYINFQLLILVNKIFYDLTFPCLTRL